MQHCRSFLAACALLLQASVCLSQPLSKTTAQNGTFQNSVYFTNWGTYSGFTPDKLPVDSITNVIYAFVNLDANGTVFSGDEEADVNKVYPGDDTSEDGNNVYGAVKQLGLLKQQNRHLKVILSIGGWSWRENFSPAASTDETRLRFAKTAVALVKDWGFDGIDIDWEFPENAADADNYVLLLKSLRSELDDYATQYADGYKFQLSAATAFSDFVQLNHIKEMGQVLDWFNIMGYGYVGSWSTLAGHQANLFFSNQSTTPISGADLIADYIDAGAPASKIVLGNPAGAVAFAGTDGLGSEFTGMSNATEINYSDLPKPGAVEYYDDEACAAYSYDEKSRTFMTYDNVQSIQRKADFILEQSLGGMFFWEASGDKVGEGSIVDASFQRLGGLSGLDTSDNLVDYPQSVYDNVKAGFA